MYKHGTMYKYNERIQTPQTYIRGVAVSATAKRDSSVARALDSRSLDSSSSPSYASPQCGCSSPQFLGPTGTSKPQA